MGQVDPPDAQMVVGDLGVGDPLERCAHCGDLDEPQRLVECGACTHRYHHRCLARCGYPPPAGPWYCHRCRARLADDGVQDCTLDTALLEYLVTGAVTGAHAREEARVRKAANYFSVDERQRLWVTGPHKGPPRHVPVLKEREPLLDRTLHALGYPGGARLYAAVRAQYYWPGLTHDCHRVAASCLARRMEHARYPPPPYLIPADKPAAPLRAWCIDTAVGFSPPAPDGATDVLVAVDPFSKWVEIGTVRTLNSHETAEWLH